MSLRRALLALIVVPFLLIAGCGDDDADDGGGGGGKTEGTVEGAKVIDPASMDGAKGQVTACGGKDTTGSKKAGTKAFNEQNPGITVKLLEFPESADEQRNQFVQRQEAKSGECDVFYSDVIWTAEFAIQNWLYDMTPYVEQRRDEFIESTFETATYEDKIWGVPHKTNAGFLYYRTDQVDAAPKTWQEVYEKASETDGIAYQGAAYEGLTVDFLELAFAAGGKVLSDDGKKAEIDSPENLAALKFMVDGIKDGAARVRGGPGHLPAQLAVRVRDREPGEGDEGQLRRGPVPGVGGRRQGGHPRRLQPRHLDLLEEPRRRAQVHRLHDA